MAFWDTDTKTAKVDVDALLNINDLDANTINDDDDMQQDDLIPVPAGISSMAVVRRNLFLYTGVLALGI